MSSLRESDGPRPKAVVVGVQLPDVDAAAFEASLRELERLAHTLGHDVIARITQKRSGLVTASVIGEGKLKELGALTGGTGVIPGYVPPGKEKKTDEEEDALEDAAAEAKAPAGEKATIVLIDHDLAPNQARNLEKATGAEVLDRSMVILNIFQRHARTREAKLQVEIARLAYMAPRMRETSGGQEQRQRGGAVGRSAGESALELDRRKIRDRIAALKKELEIVQRESDTRRNRRLGPETSTVALVGYTNAGKSSLMRALTGDEVYVADQLFATLDTTVRALKPETRPRILVSDTVGFIKKLPHDLVASFRSTLEEAKDASLLLHVVDAADPAFRDQLAVTQKVLAEIGAGDNLTLLVLNKADKLSDEAQAALAAEFPQAMIVSAKRPADIGTLHAHIVKTFEDAMEDAELFVPFSQQRNVALLHERTRVLEERYDETGTTLRVRAPGAVLGALRVQLGQ
jgi:GTP-binding protein HflX